MEGCKKNICIPKRGDRGKKGDKGDKGDPGPQGIQGVEGVPGNDGIDAIVPDTGWTDLLGFEHMTGSMAALKPQCRLIGKVLYFRGHIHVPLSNDGGSTLISLSTTTSYQEEYFNSVYTGSGGVTVDSSGGIILNNGLSCIPTSVLSGSLDGSYRTDYEIGTRQIKVDAQDGILLTTLVHIVISPDKKITLVTIKDGEELSSISGTNGNNGIGSSALRYLVTKAISGKAVRDYRTEALGYNTLHQMDVGNPSEAINTRPYISNLTGTELLYPFSVDGAEESQIGGFVFSLDGLLGFVS